MYLTTVPVIVDRGHFDKEKTLFELKRCGADRVALAVSRKGHRIFSSKEDLDILGESIAFFEKNGIETLVWIGETLGHSGEKCDGDKTYGHLRAVESGAELKSFCPLDENLIKDTAELVKETARRGAKMIMFDDDLRLSHGKESGCVCEAHLKRIREILKENAPFDVIRENILTGKDKRYRRAYLRANGESLENFCREMRCALNDADPSARLGICAASYTWDCGTDPVRLAKILAGTTKPFIRTFGAPYHAALHPMKMGDMGFVIEAERVQIARAKESGAEIFTEGDTYPRPRIMTPASYLECFDTALRADGGADGILKYALDYTASPFYETGYVDFANEHLPLYKDIEEAFGNKNCVGAVPFVPMKVFENLPPYPGKSEDAVISALSDGVYSPAMRFAELNSIPTAYGTDGANIIFGDTAFLFPEEKLKNGNILDIRAAVILAERGIDVGIKKINDNIFRGAASFTDSLAEKDVLSGEYVAFPATDYTPPVLSENCELLSFIEAGNKEYPGAFCYENRDNIKFLVLPFNADGTVKNGKGFFDQYIRRGQVLYALGKMGKTPEAVPEGNHPKLYLLTKTSENSLAVGLWNLFPDKIKGLKLKIKGDYSSVRFINSEGEYISGTVKINSTLYPYEFCAAVLEK